MSEKNERVEIRKSVSGDHFLSARGVCDKLAVSKSYLYGMIRDGVFPAPLDLAYGKRWLASDVEEIVERWAEEARERAS